MLQHWDGFNPIGHFNGVRFEIDPRWASRRGVYVWTHVDNEARTPIRVGIACGRGGFGGRYTLYNRWLAGQFKPDDRREQIIRHLTLQGLNGAADVWGKEVADKPRAIELETALRRAWSQTLKLDLMVDTSWIKLESRKRKGALVVSDSSKVRVKPSVKGHPGSPYATLNERLKALPSAIQQQFAKLDAVCRQTFSDVTTADTSRCEGRTYYLGPAKKLFCRIDANGTRIGVRFRNEILAAVKQSGKLRKNRTDGVWIYVEETDAIDPVAKLIRLSAQAAAARA